MSNRFLMRAIFLGLAVVGTVGCESRSNTVTPAPTTNIFDGMPEVDTSSPEYQKAMSQQ